MINDPNTQNDRKANDEMSSRTAIIAVVLVAILAVGGYFFYANRTNQPVASKVTVENGYDAAKSAVMPDKPASEPMK